MKILIYIILFVFLASIIGCIERPIQDNKTDNKTNKTENKRDNKTNKTETKKKPRMSYIGDTKSIGNDAYIFSFITLDEGKPYDIGVTFAEDILYVLPEEETEYILKLPKLKEEYSTAFDHIVINWNLHGHVPSGIYDKPHLDFHFYISNQTEREQIIGDDKMQKNASSEYIPSEYISTSGGVPKMGVHWIDPSSPEFKGQPFNKTFIYGFYNGTMVFMEPMITAEYLKTKPNVTESIKLPQKYPKSGYYPTRYSIKYNEEVKEYTISLGEMKKFNDIENS